MAETGSSFSISETSSYGQDSGHWGGTGYFSVRLANAVPAGKVFAVDTESDMVKYLSQLAKDKKLSNLVPVKADPNNPNLPEKVNLVLIVDTLHHIDSRVHYLARLKRELLPHSRLVVVDFNQSSKVGRLSNIAS